MIIACYIRVRNDRRDATMGGAGLTTGLGARFGDLDLSQGTIKLSPIVKLHPDKTDRTVTLELSPGSESK